MFKDTELLLEELKESSNIHDYITSNKDNLHPISFGEYLNNIIENSNKSKSKLIFDLGIAKSHFYNILNNKKMPSRDLVISIALCTCLDLDSTNLLLKRANRNELYARDLRDSIIIKCITESKSLFYTNDILYELDVKTLK